MDFLKKTGQLAGGVAGLALGGAVRVVGELAGSSFIKEIGDGVENATRFAGRTAGELASGTWDVAAGIVTQNENKLEEGFQDVGGAVSSTARGIGHLLVNVVENSTNVVKGIGNKDTELVKTGAKGLIYTTAVGAIAVGIIDVLDGPDGTSPEAAAEAAPEGAAGAPPSEALP